MKRLTIVAMFVVLLSAQMGYGMKKEVLKITVGKGFIFPYNESCIYVFTKAKADDSGREDLCYNLYVFEDGREMEETSFTMPISELGLFGTGTSTSVPKKIKRILLKEIEKYKKVNT